MSILDPVCGMEVDPKHAAGPYPHAGKDYYFCCEGCLEEFEKSPDKYLAPKPHVMPSAGHSAPADPKAIYTCPMHPEIRKIGPGSCPICGMALEPLEETSAEEKPDPELIDMRRRFAASAVLSAGIVALSTTGKLPWLQLVLATITVFAAGFPLLARAIASIRHKSPNMFTLIGIGVVTAYATSATALFSASAADLYFEPAAVITALTLLGQVLELTARSRTGRAVRALLKLAPQTARIVRPDGTEEDIATGEVKPGDRLRVRPGESVPVDGKITEGESAIDESLVTGEPLPAEKGPGDEVIAGTINAQGSFVFEATRIGAETLLARIIRQVQEAKRTRAPIQRLADRASEYFVPAVIAAAALAFAYWRWLAPHPDAHAALANAVAVLIVACPCALGLASPMSILVATGEGARQGVLARDAEALEELGRVDTLVVDKTGTLTAGRPEVVAIQSLPARTQALLLETAAALEKASEHPLASAVLRAASDQGIRNIPEVTEFRAVRGKGVQGRIRGVPAAIGSPSFLKGLEASSPELEETVARLEAGGRTVVAAALGGNPLGAIAISDPLKPGAKEALAELRNAGLAIVMLTGDRRPAAEAVAQSLGVPEFKAEALPEDKASAVKELARAGRRVAMAGDGINDAPALAAARVGIAMGTGADAAIQTAGITLVRGDLQGILRARKLSQATMRNIRQNLFFAVIYNFLGVPLAAAGGLTPMIASLAMSLSSASVIANALRLGRSHGRRRPAERGQAA